MTPEQINTLKRRLWIGAWLAVAVLGGVLVGRFIGAAETKTRDVERVVYRDLTVEDITRGFTFAKQVEVTRWRNVVTAPDGTITDRTIEREGSAESGTVTEAITRVETVEVERERIVEKTVTLRSDWRVSVLAGASLRDPLLPIAGPLVLGMSAERRIAGGLSVGLWVNTFGAAGGVVSMEF